jgi:hypothetical protein
MRGRRKRNCGIAIAGVTLSLIGLAVTAKAQTIASRGDANCSGTISAADLVAVVRGSAGASACGNEDCDRNGETDTTDGACTVGCLFGTCPTPPNAPRISEVSAGSAPGIVPFSAIRLSGANFGTLDHLTRVTIGGIEAEVVDLELAGGGAGDTTDTLEAIVPGGLPAGPADVFVFDRDVAGPAMPIVIESHAPIGETDTFDGTMGLLDTATAKLAALDLDGAFGENAEPLSEALQRFRDQLAMRRAEFESDASITPDVRLQVDAAFDGSGTPDMLRDLIDEIDAVATDSNGIGATAATPVVLAFRRGARTIRVVKGVAGAAGTIIAVPSAPILAGVSLVAGVATGIIIAAVSSASGAPFITDMLFDTAIGPHAGSIVTVRGRRLGSSLNLRARMQGATPFLFLPQSVSSFELTYRLSPRLCGPFEFDVGSDTSPRLYSIRSGIVPELRSLFPTSEKAGGRVVADTSGVGACGGNVEFYTDRNVVTSSFSAGLRPIEGQPIDDFLLPETATPRSYFASVRTDRSGFEFVPFEVLLAVTGLRVDCAPTELDIPPAAPSSASCTAKALPLGTAFPTAGTFSWTSSAPEIAFVSANQGSATALALAPGTADISASFTIENSRFASANGVTLNVRDRTDPAISISSESAAQKVRPGSLITVRARAVDNLGVRRILLHATGDAVEGDQEFDCEGQRDCATLFGVHVKDTELQSRQVTLRADAFDVSGLRGRSNQLAFEVTADDACPEVEIQSPADGAIVRAGDSVQISALVTDNQPDDTGVRTVRVNATGDAVASPPLPMEVTLPAPLPRVTRLATFMVRNAADLAGIANRSITISASASDDARNSCEPKTVTVTAGGPPQITAVAPSPVGAGRNVTISGSGFGETQGSGTVTIGGLPAPVSSWSNATIQATVPTSLSGMHVVVVTVDQQTSNGFPIQVLGTGDVQITLEWSDSNDLDLHVTEPSGEVINYINTRSSTGGRLDADANAGCGGGGAGRENVFWPQGQAPSGPYQVRVVYFRGCTEDPLPSMNVRVTATVDGQFMVLLNNVTVPVDGSVGAGFTRSAPQ